MTDECCVVRLPTERKVYRTIAVRFSISFDDISKVVQETRRSIPRAILEVEQT